MAKTIGGRTLGGATIAFAAAVASCSAIIGIGDRVADETATGEAGADSTPPLDPVVDAASAALTYGVGDGHWGSLTISSGSTTVNSYAPLQAPVSGTSSLVIRATRGAAFVAGDLVLVWQTATTTPPPSSGPAIDLAAANVGHWELARVTAITGLDGGSNELALDHRVGVVQPFTTPGAQVVRVPEYQDLTIEANRGIDAARWDGTIGGIVALYVRGTLTSNGGVYADGAGFRGGVALLTNDGGLAGCTAADGLPEDGFARKGEGFVLGLYDGGGLGNAAHGGGGGDCSNAGGGGGGHGGQGGQGGLSRDGDRDVGGRGGAALAYTLPDRLMLGGGGGAGEQDDGTARPGGAGGGVILVRAQEIALPGGRFGARGGSPGRTDYSGAPGGGAGGTIALQAAGTLACQSATVGGGNGASFASASGNGPGGGGAGGRMLIQGGATACSLETRAGAAGHDGPDNTTTRGATPDAGAELGPPYTAAAQLIPSPYCGTCP